MTCVMVKLGREAARLIQQVQIMRSIHSACTGYEVHHQVQVTSPMPQRVSSSRYHNLFEP